MTADRLGVVVIGRNEGARLVRGLRALPAGLAVVYVDSGSSDDSVAQARQLGAEVVLLDMAQPFTAARARNAGWQTLLNRHPGIVWVQFMDGDCELAAGWLEAAQAHLQAHPEIAVVCGRRRERYPAASIYNWMCDQEWDTPIGQAKACGGDALMRADALRQVGGYRDDLIAGEEPEMCLRLRARGWQIWRLDAEMTLHDAAMLRFSQWWQRTKRGGFAFAQGAALHGASEHRHWVREAARPVLWAGLVPAGILCAVLLLGPKAAWLLMVYPLQILRVAMRLPGRVTQRLAFASFLVLGKFAELVGVLKYLVSRLGHAPARLIEYK